MRFQLSIFALVFIVIIGCTIKTPEVTFTSERTALEKQILGTYRTIEEDAWMVSSMRSSEEQQLEIPESKRMVLLAFANRKYNADDVDDFKRDGVVGENLSGLLTLFETNRYKNDEEYRLLVDKVLTEENRDREIIMQRIVEINTSVDPLDQAAVTSVFAQMNRESSPAGCLIQNVDGSWTQK